MKAIILNMLNFDWILPRLQQMIELQPSVNAKNTKKTQAERPRVKDRDLKDVTQKDTEDTPVKDTSNWRIPDEDLQFIIDAQLSNFESFKIPEKTVQSREIDELEALRNQAKDLYQRQMAGDSSKVETVTATTREQEETTPDSVLETSTTDADLSDS